MKAKVNALLHLSGALYSVIFVIFIGLSSVLPGVSGLQVNVPLAIGIVAVFLDTAAAFLQLRTPPSGYLLSAALHFIFAQTVVITIIFEYWQSGSHQFISWFVTNGFTFPAMLAVARTVAGISVSVLPVQDRRLDARIP